MKTPPRIRERPLLFSAPMVRALLAGTKTQTRRMLKPQPSGSSPVLMDNEEPAYFAFGAEHYVCSYGAPGDRLWVRETCQITTTLAGYKIRYRADDAELWPATDGLCYDDHTWRPSIHMPRCASRLTLEITAIRVERLNAISEQDAIAEGVDIFEHGAGFMIPGCAWQRNPEDAYRNLWESINGPASWDANPWVWVISFKKI